MVADWKQQELVRENGESSSAPSSAFSAGTIKGGNSNSGGDCGGRKGEDDGKTPSIEKEHVQAVYDTIAPHWYVGLVCLV